MTGFQPFEHMAWAKQVPAGARFPMQVSGLAPPSTPLPIAQPDQQIWTAAPGPAREALSDGLRAYLGAPDRDLMIVGGASEAIFIALAGHVERGAPVIVERPAYAAMERCVQFLGGVPHRLERRGDDGWRLDPDRLSDLLSRTGARIVALTDPHNPTGTSIDRGLRPAIVAVAERHGALVIVDETFASFRGPDRPPAWAAESDRVLSLGSLTKAWGLSSLRTGWVLGPPLLLAPCEQVFNLTGVHPPSVTMSIACEVLHCATDLDRRALRASHFVHETFAESGIVAAGMTGAADGIIGFLPLPTGLTADAAAQVLRDLDGIQVVPGHFFGRDDHIRIGFDPEHTDGSTACRLIQSRLTQSDHQ